MISHHQFFLLVLLALFIGTMAQQHPISLNLPRLSLDEIQALSNISDEMQKVRMGNSRLSLNLWNSQSDPAVCT